MKRNIYSVCRDSYRYLYTAALAVCGNELAAEDVLLDVLTAADPRTSFDRLLRSVISAAMERAQDVSGVEFLSDTPLGEETAAVRRAVMLSEGLKMSPRRIAKLLDVPVSRVRAMLKRAEGTQNLRKLCVRELEKGVYAPDSASFRQALRNRGIEEKAAAGSGRGTAVRLSAILLALLTGALIWLGAVMIDYYARTLTGTQTEAIHAGTDAGNDVND